MNTLITGASSGIGEALAVECAKRGDTLFLCGRDKPRLDAVVEKCRASGAAASGRVIDVRDGAAVRDWMRECDRTAPVERVFSNAGVGTGVENAENTRTTFDINVGGNLNTVLAALELFRESPQNRREKQILMTASIAGYGPLRSCPAYSATKSCIKTWGLALRGMLKREGIKVSVICPGFVRSRITDKNTCPMPFFMEAPKAAKIILARADRNVGLIAFPWQMRFASWSLSVLPAWLNDLINRFIPEKNSSGRNR